MVAGMGGKGGGGENPCETVSVGAETVRALASSSSRPSAPSWLLPLPQMDSLFFALPLPLLLPDRSRRGGAGAAITGGGEVDVTGEDACERGEGE